LFAFRSIRADFPGKGFGLEARLCEDVSRKTTGTHRYFSRTEDFQSD
jgi:hypothetical protein